MEKKPTERYNYDYACLVVGYDDAYLDITGTTVLADAGMSPSLWEKVIFTLLSSDKDKWWTHAK
jgi:hypothetical protein